MTREEIEKAIENGESVWVVYKGQSNVYEIKAYKIEKVLNDTFLWGKEYYSNIKDVYKAEAEHFLHHANVTRTETLPFLTWEEFLEEENIVFNNGKEDFILYISDRDCGYIIIAEYNKYHPYGDVIFETPLTEANFYKAYDECVRLFKGEE